MKSGRILVMKCFVVILQWFTERGSSLLSLDKLPNRHHNHSLTESLYVNHDECVILCIHSLIAADPHLF